MKFLTFSKNLFKPIKSPVGEKIGDDSYVRGIEYMTEDIAQSTYIIAWQDNYCYPGSRRTHRGLHGARSFADWIEAQGVRLL